jgi:hypothetical protein
MGSDKWGRDKWGRDKWGQSKNQKIQTDFAHAAARYSGILGVSYMASSTEIDYGES